MTREWWISKPLRGLKRPRFKIQSKLSAGGRKVFAFPDHEDSCSHLAKDIVMKLPWPTIGTSRAAKTFDFHCPVLDAYSIE